MIVGNHRTKLSIYLVLCLLSFFLLVVPKNAEARSWKAEVKKYSPNAECTALVLHVIQKESGGNPNARNGQHLGLMQFNRNWGSAEKRLDPVWSIKRIVRVYEATGQSGIYKHWCRWHGCSKRARVYTPKRPARKAVRRSDRTPALLKIRDDLLESYVGQGRLDSRHPFSRLARMEERISGFRVQALQRHGDVEQGEKD